MGALRNMGRTGMADHPGTGGGPGDDGSHPENRRFDDLVERSRASNPELRHPAPTGGWRPDLGDIVLHLVGDGIIVAVLAMHLLGYY